MNYPQQQQHTGTQSIHSQGAPPMRIQDQESLAYHQHMAAGASSAASQQQNYQPFNDEYGTEGMELTPSASSEVHQIGHHNSDPMLSGSFGQSPPPQIDNGQQRKQASSSLAQPYNYNAIQIQQNYATEQELNEDDDTEELLNQQYNQLVAQQTSNKKEVLSSSKAAQYIQPQRIQVTQVPSQQVENRNYSLPQNSRQTPGFQSINDSVQSNNNNMPLQAPGLNQQQQPGQIVEKLTQKCREQAERLQFLDNYKTLCERRIKDFDPQHQFPVLPSHIGKISNNFKIPKGSTQEQYIEALQKRVGDLQQETIYTNEIKKRLQQVEESLRSETLQNEEQRAYIQILRETLDQKLSQMGFNFRGAQGSSAVDGFFQLMNTQRQFEQIKSDHQKTQIQLQDTLIKHNETLERMQIDFEAEQAQLRGGHQTQVQQMLQKIKEIKEEVEQLKQDKDTLLNFVEEKVLLEKQKDETIQNQQQELIEQENQIKDQTSKYEDLFKSKKQQDEFLVQVQNNMKQIREDKESLNGQLEKLQKHIDDLGSQNHQKEKLLIEKEQTIKQYHEDLKKKEQTLQEKTSDLMNVKLESSQHIQTVEREIRHQKDKLSDQERTIQIYKEQIDELQIKCNVLSDANNSLTKTLIETQEELEKLVSIHERASNQQKQQEREFLQIRQQLQENQEQLNERTKSYNDLRVKDQIREKEIQDLYASLGHKDQIVSDCENRLLRTIREKEQECQTLVYQVENLENERRESTSKIQFLERMTEDQKHEVTQLKQTVDLKKNIIEDIQSQIRKVRDDSHQEFQSKERTMTIQLNDKEKKELELSFKLTQTIDELKVMKDQKTQAEKLLVEKIESLNNQESELNKRQQQLNRWEGDIQKLEQQLSKGNERNEYFRQENERVRVQRVDDAMLIDQMRSQQNEVREILNSIIGQITIFSEFLNNIDEGKIGKDIENLYENCINIKPLSEFNESSSVLKSLKQILTNLMNMMRKQDGPITQSTMGFRTNQIIESPPQKEDWAQNTLNQDEIRMFQATNDNMRQSVEQLQIEKEKYLMVKQKLDSLDHQLALEQIEKQELDDCLRRIVNLRSLNQLVKKVLTDLVQAIKEHSQLKNEKQILVSRLQSKEQRYHTLNRGVTSGGPSYQREISSLKATIEKERGDTRDFDLKIENCQREIDNLHDELLTVDSMADSQEEKNNFENFNLAQQLEDLRKANTRLLSEKDWAEKRLIEFEDSMARFNLPKERSGSKGAALRNSLQQIQDTENRLYWPTTQNRDSSSFISNKQGSANELLKFQMMREQLKQESPDKQENQSRLTYQYSKEQLSNKQQPIQERNYQKISQQHQPLRNFTSMVESPNLDNYKSNMKQYEGDGQLQSQSFQQYQQRSLTKNENAYNQSIDNSKIDIQDQQQLQQQVSLKDKIQQVKTIFNSIRRNIDN